MQNTRHWKHVWKSTSFLSTHRRGLPQGQFGWNVLQFSKEALLGLSLFLSCDHFFIQAYCHVPLFTTAVNFDQSRTHMLASSTFARNSAARSAFCAVAQAARMAAINGLENVLARDNASQWYHIMHKSLMTTLSTFCNDNAETIQNWRITYF